MQIRISSPIHYETLYGSSVFIRKYLDEIEKKIGESYTSDHIDILRISLLIAHPEELAQGKFLEYEKYDWRCAYVALGINGDFERYHSGDDLNKICELAEMLQTAFVRLSLKKRANFDCKLANKIVVQTTQAFQKTGDG